MAHLTLHRCAEIQTSQSKEEIEKASTKIIEVLECWLDSEYVVTVDKEIQLDFLYRLFKARLLEISCRTELF